MSETISPNWYEPLSDEQIEWLKNNRVPNYMLTPDELALINAVPAKDRQWRDGRTYWATDKGIQEVCSDSYAIHRLRPDWDRPEELPYIDAKPYIADGIWKVHLPTCVEWFQSIIDLGKLDSCSQWLLTRYEAIDKDGTVRLWDDYRGGIVGRGYDSTPESGASYGKPHWHCFKLESLRPVLIRFLKKVPHE